MADIRDTMYMVKFPVTSLSQACFKVFNEVGDELSLAADDSCGALRHFSRLEMCRFNAADPHAVVENVYSPTPQEFLGALANLLGYEIKKR